MKYINKKQKIVLIIIISIITLGIGYYTYTTKTNDEFSIEEQNLEIEENEREKEINENIKENTKIIVHVSGAVRNEGIVELKEKSRIADAIEMVGGVTEDAYMKDVNLATILEDGMKIYIPTKEEVEKQRENKNDSVSKDTNLDIYNNSSNTRKKNNKVNINTASKEELDTLPGIGESTANKIISYREEKGNFKSIEEIKEVSGIGDSKYEQIKNLIEI